MYDMPKVINLFGLESYHDRFPQLSIMTERPCFVKILKYDIVIPLRQKIKDDFNVFERTIIRLSELGINSAERAADTICIPLDLAKFIFSRLTELGIFEKNGSLTEAGRNYLKGQNSTEDIMLFPAAVFALEATGEFLPVVIPEDDIVYENARFDGARISMNIGSAGNAVRKSAEIIKTDSALSDNRLFPAQKVLKKIIDGYNNLLIGMGKPVLSYYHDRMIEVSAPTKIYFYVKAAIQKGNVDNILCSEGMIINNDIIGRIINNDPGFKSKLYSSAAVTDTNVGTSENTASFYGEITRNFPCKIYEKENLDDKKANYAQIRDNMRRLFVIIEHAFDFYIKANKPSTDILSMFRTQNSADNQTVLYNYLLNMGADMHKCSQRVISMMNANTLNTYITSGVPSIYAVVPLAIAEARMNQDSTIRNMIKKHPEFLEELAVITKKAGEFRHGNSSDVNISENKYNTILENARDMISLILPDVQFNEEKHMHNSGLTSDSKVKAIAALSDELGAIRYYSLSPQVQNELIRTSPDKSDSELPIASEVILSFCRILENILFTACAEIPGTLSADKKEALSRIEMLTLKPAPSGFSKVNEHYIVKASLRKKSSLGGLALVYILNKDIETVQGFIKNNYHDFIDTLTGYRAHGNNVTLYLSMPKIKQLRKTLYDFIAFFGG